MTREESLEIKDTIKEYRNGEVEELFLIFYYMVQSLMKNTISYGFNHDFYHEVKKLGKEVNMHIKEERTLLKYIEKLGLENDYTEIMKFLSEIDSINEQTIRYYYQILDDFDDNKIRKRKKRFPSLLDSLEYRKEVCGFYLSISDVINFFNYSEEFWNYAFSKTMRVDIANKESEGFYGVFYLLDQEENIQGFKIVVPRIVNLSTALINVYEYKQAHDLYEKFNQKVSEDEEYEASARKCEKEFEEKYLSKRFNRLLRWK